MMDKNKYKTLSIALEKETLEKLNEYCKGKTLKSIFVRRLIERELNRIFGDELEAKKENTRKKVIKIKVDNYDELKAYVDEKKLGSVRTLFTFSMAHYMRKYPAKSGKNKNSFNQCVD